MHAHTYIHTHKTHTIPSHKHIHNTHIHTSTLVFYHCSKIQGFKAVDPKKKPPVSSPRKGDAKAANTPKGNGKSSVAQEDQKEKPPLSEQKPASEQPAATSTEQPAATSTEQPAATSAEQPAATSTEQPAATSTEQPAATSSDSNQGPSESGLDKDLPAVSDGVAVESSVGANTSTAKADNEGGPNSEQPLAVGGEEAGSGQNGEEVAEGTQEGEGQRDEQKSRGSERDLVAPDGKAEKWEVEGLEGAENAQ